MNLSCAAKHLCKLTALPLTESDSTKHTCFKCKLRMHGPCGHLWEDFEETKAFKDRLGVNPSKPDNAPLLEICFLCISDEKAKVATESQSTKKVSETSASTTTAAAVKKATTKKVPSSQTLLPGAKRPAKIKKKQTARKSDNRDYSMREKYDMAIQYQKALKGAKSTLCEKWGVHNSTASRWVKDIDNMKLQIDAEGRGGKKTVRRKGDPLQKIKAGVVKFYETNKTRTKHFKIPITAKVISTKALKLKDEILRQHKNGEMELTEEEEEKISKFTASETWSKTLAKDMGWKSRALHGEAGCVDHDAAAPGILEIREIIHGGKYSLENVYNMDETGLLFKCLPNRSYVSEDEVKTARGTKLMKAKSRVTLYVCTNANGSDFVPLSMIGSAEKPRCFSNHEMKLRYYNQKKAWSDTKTSKKWFADFLAHVRRRTNDPVLLIMDNCAAHNDDTFKDPSGQVEVVFLPPNCTSVYQPMDCGVIALIKKLYRHCLLLKLHEVYDDMMDLYDQNKGRTAGTNGVEQGYPPHLRDCMDILVEITKDVTPTKIHNCWKKSTLLDAPPADADVEMVEPSANTDIVVDSVDFDWKTNDDEEDKDDDADDDDDEERIFDAMIELAKLVKELKREGEGEPPRKNWEMTYMLDEMMQAVEEIDSSDPNAKKELLNGWV